MKPFVLCIEHTDGVVEVIGCKTAPDELRSEAIELVETCSFPGARLYLYPGDKTWLIPKTTPLLEAKLAKEAAEKEAAAKEANAKKGKGEK